MEHDNKENSFLSAYWQDLNTRIDRDDSTPREKSDGYRKVLGFLNKLRSRKLINGYVYQKLSNSAYRKYTAVVDCMDDKEGMNNYASSIMELVSGLRNESNSWKSSLGEFDSPTCQQFVSDIMEKAKASDAPCETISLKCKCRETQYAENADNIARGDERASLIEAQNNVTINTTKDSATSSPRVPRNMNQDIALPGQHMKISKQPTSNQPAVFAKRKFEEISATEQKQSRPDEYSFSRTESLSSEKSFIHSNRPGEKPTNTGNETPETTTTTTTTTFLTAREQYIIDQRTKNRSTSDGRSIKQSDYGLTKKSLGTRRGTSSKFTPPVMNKQPNETASTATTTINRSVGSSSLKNGSNDASMDERLKNIDSRMIEMIENEIMDHGPAVSWSDIAGLEFAKNTIQEIVIWPMLRPDIFKGLRGPPKGLLLFGPPGTGKTLIGKCIASQSRATFFSISASSLTSKWIGDGEKMVRALFGVARCQESAVIFIDEIDSLLSQRSDGEHEATRRIKTEFLVQLDGATTKAEERILVVGATNRPQELDEAARRRLVKRLYIPLPDAEARRQIVVNLMTEQRCSLDKNDLDMIMESSDGYSGADMANLCREAALGPIRSISRDNIQFIKSDEVRPIIYKDFEDAFRNIRPSVSLKDLELYTQWNKQYGSGVGI